MPSQPRQSLSRPAALLVCNGWRRQQQSTHICKSFFHEEACHGAEKEGPLGGPSWVSPHQILGEGRIAVRDVSRCGKIDLPESLLDELLLGGIFRHFRRFCYFFLWQTCLSSSPVGCSRFCGVWCPFIFDKTKNFKENEKRRIQARVRHR